jgi:hypothetical protein
LQGLLPSFFVTCMTRYRRDLELIDLRLQVDGACVVSLAYNLEPFD